MKKEGTIPMAQKVTVFGSFVVDLMARAPRLPVPGETVLGSFFKQGAGGGRHDLFIVDGDDAAVGLI